MQLDKFLIALLIFSAVVLTGVLMIGDINNSYNKTNDNYSDTYFTNISNKSEAILDSLYSVSLDMKDDTLGADVEEDSTEDSMFKGSFSAIRLVKDSFGLVGNVMTVLEDAIGVPKMFIGLTMTAISILVIFSLIYLVFRFKS